MKEVEKTLRVLKAVREDEADHDHIQIIEDAEERVRDMAGGNVSVTDEPTEDDVEVALDVLSGDDFSSAYEFVDLGAMYVNGPLPEPRDWTVRYILPDGDLLKEESIPFADVTDQFLEHNGKRYETGNRDYNGTTIDIELEPERYDLYSVGCWDCDEIGYFFDTGRAAVATITEHEEEYPDHTAGYTKVDKKRVLDRISRVSGVGDATVDEIDRTFIWDDLKDIVKNPDPRFFSIVSGIGDKTAEKIVDKIEEEFHE